MLSIKNKKNAPVIVDDFDFGRMPSGNLLDDQIDIDTLRKGCIADPDNGVWNGWVFAKVVTDRFRVSCPLDAPLFYFYLTIDTNKVIFYKD